MQTKEVICASIINFIINNSINLDLNRFFLVDKSNY